MGTRQEILCLFDVDGTLTYPRQSIDPEFKEFLMTVIKPRATLGIVGGSDLGKMLEQVGEDVLEKFDYVFPENGCIQHKNGVETGRADIIGLLGEEKLQTFINFVLRYLSDLSLPFKRGTFIEFRASMFNICPVGRSCTKAERDEFEKYDKIHNVRINFINALKERFVDYNFKYSIGGQISFDVFPQGWDKTYCLQYVTEFTEIHFFGDKVYEWGNDHEIYEDPRTVGHKVTTPEETKQLLKKLFNI